MFNINKELADVKVGPATVCAGLAVFPLIRKHPVTRDYLTLSEAFGKGGVEVSEVSEGSPAEKAGFLAGDTLIAIDDQEVTDLRTYSQILRTLEQAGELRRCRHVHGFKGIGELVQVHGRGV